MGKQKLFLPTQARATSTDRCPKWNIILLLASVLALLWTGFHVDIESLDGPVFNGAPTCVPHTAPICPQAPALSPQVHKNLLADIESEYVTGGFKSRVVEWLRGAVRIKTVTHDDMRVVGNDSRWDVFGEFHSYLKEAFPLVHDRLEVTNINTYGLVYRWEGSDASLKPLLLMAHQDVVPVQADTVTQWVRPPFSGYFDGEFLWGRGAWDDKQALIAILYPSSLSIVFHIDHSFRITLETLLKHGYKPTRTIFFVSGFDEEIGGHFGAGRIASHFLSTYGENHFAMLVDEGAPQTAAFGARVAALGISEKGYTNVKVSVASPGGHSSVPPTHTSIGLLALALVHLEENPEPAHLTRTSPLYELYQCQAEHSPNFPEKLKRALRKSLHNDKALKRAEKLLFTSEGGDVNRIYLHTTQAIDLIGGGVKVNALPELAWALINHRIATDSSVNATHSSIVDKLTPIARGLQLDFEAFGFNVTTELDPAGQLTLSHFLDDDLEPAPVSPPNSAPFQLLAGTIRETWETGRGKDSEEPFIVAPSIMPANTGMILRPGSVGVLHLKSLLDTKYFWKLTPHIFRYNHLGMEDMGPLKNHGGMHSVNEAIRIDGYHDQIRFFTHLILNADEANL
ncbi:carboxypeptidase S [Cantharellus anzutake]|uniref:carboxypeptidase S n=1 Tax=Cantharellus anzutake TaxID=1750568 RepID=UPI0019032027|nr:carboxypeptidase S [Cantharellus anzutake]KAF8308589.1 carboxypeptidase S [Cantharellus anzutake]